MSKVIDPVVAESIRAIANSPRELSSFANGLMGEVNAGTKSLPDAEAEFSELKTAVDRFRVTAAGNLVRLDFMPGYLKDIEPELLATLIEQGHIRVNADQRLDQTPFMAFLAGVASCPICTGTLKALSKPNSRRHLN